jgi:excinuclease ABC subunit A
MDAAAVHRDSIVLEGVRVHNLQNLDLEIPLHRLVVITGISGSGKSSLAFDTLAVEGQRRYIETLSPTSRGLLDRLDRPEADRIENIPPTIAIRQGTDRAGARETVGTATEIHDLLRLLFAASGEIRCPDCKIPVTTSTPASIADDLGRLPDGCRYQVAFAAKAYEPDAVECLERLAEDGFRRLAVLQPGEDSRETADLAKVEEHGISTAWIILDRLTSGSVDPARIEDSLEQALTCGDGRCLVLIEDGNHADPDVSLDGDDWQIQFYSTGTACDDCGRAFHPPEPRLFSFHSPLGACPECHGFGQVPVISFDKLVPDPRLSLREGAIAAWTTPAYSHELDELLTLASDYGIPVDVAFDELSQEQLDLIVRGVPERNFGGLEGFFDWLERHRYKLPVRVFLNRWRAYDTCNGCHGGRLQPDALAVHLPVGESGCTIDWLCTQTIAGLKETLAEISDIPADLSAAVLDPLLSRLDYLHEVGLEYLTLDRPLRSLSGGEARRVLLTAALGSELVNTLYVLDEPTAGLHARDVARVKEVIGALVQRGNSVVVVEHDPAFVTGADEVIDIGPSAGENGGRLVFQGPPAELADCADSLTGGFLSGRLPAESVHPGRDLEPTGQVIILTGADRHNLQNLTVPFPLGCLVVVTGVSGSGKSSLVEDTLFPALCRAIDQPLSPGTSTECCWDSITVDESIDQVLLIDPSPIGRTPRSIPVTYLKAFDDIRRVFAETAEARQRGYAAGQFSFNSVEGGRCRQCGGSGEIAVDMQFLADIRTTCPECRGQRFGREVLEVTFRGRSIADVLSMTVDEAFGFFRGQARIRRRLQPLRDVGLGYLPLGQPAPTLSGGESQRLKLAAFLAAGAGKTTMFLLNEPTTGLHPADVQGLLACFDTLLSVGHSLVVVEHHLEVIAAAAHVIDLGPGAGPDGGRLVVCGSPTDVASCPDSVTGHWLGCYNHATSRPSTGDR